MRSLAKSLAEQAFGRYGIPQCRQQEVYRSTGGIDGPIEVTPTALDSNICLINSPGSVGRLKMTPQSLFQFGTVSLHPTPDRRVIRLKTALGEQFFDIAERERVAKIPAHRTKNQLRRRLPPLEDCRSGCVLHDPFSLPAFPAKVATHPIVGVMHREQVRRSPWIQCDDTTLDVQDPSRAPEIRTGHLWVYRGELGEVVYDFTWSRNRDGPLKMLAGYGGYLQVDAAPAYDDVFAQHPEIIEVGCMAHARRYFKEALPTAAVPCAQTLAIVKPFVSMNSETAGRGLIEEQS